MQYWKEVPVDWIYTGNPEDVNAEIRVHMARRDLHHNEVASILGIKRQAFARRLHGETPWRWSELVKLDDAWQGAISPMITEIPANGGDAA